MLWPSVAIAVLSCVAMAALGGLLTGKGGVPWFKSLARPRFQIPMWAFFAVAGIVYLIYGVVLYRLLTEPIPRGPRVVCLTAVGAAMLYSEVWNWLFFGLRSTLAGFVGMIGFVPALVVMETALFVFEPVSAWVMLPYALYFAAYDIPWGLALWRLNR
jgi:tryptophan-rich sensory protein